MESPSSLFDVDKVLREATVAEKVGLISGKDAWHTYDIPRLGVPSIRFTDGSDGARGTGFDVSLPCGTALGATWNRELVRQGGELIGLEVKASGAQIWLGPTVNIQRSPLGGRNFQSFAEDPLLSGKLAGSYIGGAQSKDIVSTLRHFVANDQEHERMAVDVRITERALREIYLLPFQIALKKSKPGVIIASCNKVNGLHVSESPALLEDVLRREWGFKGMIMSDWHGTYSTVEAINAGLDLEMPGPSRLRGKLAELAVSSRKVSHATLDARARNVLNLVKRCERVEYAFSSAKSNQYVPADGSTNRRLARESIVLLKNDSGILPISYNKVDEIALIGPNLKNGAYCGGSAQFSSSHVVTNYEGIVNRLSHKGRYNWDQVEDAKINYDIGVHTWGFLPLLGSQITSPDALVKGLRMFFFSEPPSTPKRKIVDIMDITDSIWDLTEYSHAKLGPEFWVDVEGTFCADETGDYEWGIACCGTASLFIDGAMVIDNTTTQQPGNSFFGRGSTEKKAVMHIEEGQNYKIKVEFGSLPTLKIHKEGVVAYGGAGAGRIGVWPVSDPDKTIPRAAALAARCKYTIEEFESEGFDRPTMDLPESIDRLIAAVLDANPDAIIVTQSGAPINMQPWASRAKAMVHMWYGGGYMGTGLADVLFGDASPSGKLPVTFPNAIEDTPAFLNFESERGRTVYGEGVYVGYRYYEKLKKSVAFPFGHGLSYTTFALSELSISPRAVTLSVHNTGMFKGAAVVQLYISPSPTNTVSRPMKELKGFTKIFLDTCQCEEVVMRLDRLSTSFWDETLGCWLSEKGTYGIHVGHSSANIVLTGTLEVKETTTWTGLDF
ncbi:hypothetical protein N7516_006763 [Penicillium verrucosum]|uniref:uncharacterized protein n=1 Tax=Penicillium verrucosum TaxID=60171 RepID=UPI00254541D6|nr:uncharacterized protein N7516_006763 [Penicillium verrucosum]KAJ5932274.1 hypothetical protein N7516_006763 [Penicillium verrucosum]